MNKEHIRTLLDQLSSAIDDADSGGCECSKTADLQSLVLSLAARVKSLETARNRNIGKFVAMQMRIDNIEKTLPKEPVRKPAKRKAVPKIAENPS